MDLRITFFKHHITHEHSCIKQSHVEPLPWDSVQSVRMVGDSCQESVQRQMRRYLSGCAKAVRHELRQNYRAEKMSGSLEKRFRRLRHAKRSIEKAMYRLRGVKVIPVNKHSMKAIQERQEKLFLERWPLILEREESYRQFNLLVHPHLEKLFAGSLDPVIASSGCILDRKHLKKDQKAVASFSLAKLSAKLRSLQAQLDIYHPRHLPKASHGSWKQELNEHLSDSLAAVKCECPNCHKDMNVICMETGRLFCQDHSPAKNALALEWAEKLAGALREMQSN